MHHDVDDWEDVPTDCSDSWKPAISVTTQDIESSAQKACRYTDVYRLLHQLLQLYGLNTD